MRESQAFASQLYRAPPSPASRWLPQPNQGQGQEAQAALRFLETAMDIEQINAIGTLLSDLQARTDALRGYL